MTTMESFLESIRDESAPPAGLSPELKALWLIKADRWDEAHDIAQEIPSAMGSWIHGLLHAIEGDSGNADYWFRRAGHPAIRKTEIDAEWIRITMANLPGGRD